MAKLPVALALYTVRDSMEADYLGTLRKVADMGYNAVELENPTHMSAAELKALLADLGLRAVASHIGFDELESDPSGVLATAKELGCDYAVCPAIPEERRGDAAAYRAAAGVLDRAGAAAREHGLVFAYHNHAYEFERLDGRAIYDILMEATSADLVAAEFDVYWARYGGVDPVASIRKLGSRCRLIHMKDMADDTDRSFAEVGEGILDMEAIVAVGREVGARWYIVEQDESTKRPSLEAAALSLNNMRSHGWA
ncbi:MAG: sugar phosphate isomerase/epimerase family protein [Chloroflexota bacterium]